MFVNTANNVPSSDVETIQAGRPRVVLPHEVQETVERLYRDAHTSQARIAQEVGIAIPRVRRHLIDSGLYRPRSIGRTPERAKQLDDAVQGYIEGEKVVDICQEHYVNPAELYRELRRRDIPFRTKDRLGIRHGP